MGTLTIEGQRISHSKAFLTVEGESFRLSYEWDFEAPRYLPQLLLQTLRSKIPKIVQGKETLNLLARLSLPCNNCLSFNGEIRVRDQRRERTLDLIQELNS